MKKNFLRPCPICSNNIAEKLHTQQFVIPSGVPLPEEYDIVSCLSCAFVYADTSHTELQYEKYYEQYAKYESTISNDADDQRHTATADYLVKHLQKNHKILDIGCSNGDLLKKLSNRGYPQLTGVDPSKRCIEHIRQHGVKGHALTLSTIQNHLNQLGLHDFIILSHIMEHLLYPNKMMQMLHSLLNMNGLVYIEVPDAAQYRNNFFNPFHYFDIEHINHFDASSLMNLVEQNGFSVIETGNKMISVSEIVNIPATYILFKHNPTNTKPKLRSCNKLKEAIKEYISLSLNTSNTGNIHALAISQKPLILWGIGSYAQNLLKASPLKSCNIVAIVDRDIQKQGLTIFNKVIQSPDILLQHRYPNAVIFISSIPFKNEIAEEISKMKLDYPILYN